MPDPADQRSTDSMIDASLTGPGGWGAKYRGSNTMMLVLLLAMASAAAIVIAVLNHEANAKEREVAQMARDLEMKTLIGNNTKSIETTARNQEAMIYVLTLDDKQRKALNLGKPDRLKEMQR